MILPQVLIHRRDAKNHFIRQDRQDLRDLNSSFAFSFFVLSPAPLNAEPIQLG
jgi:hypothetical protein